MKHAKIAVAVLLGSMLTTAPAFAAFEGLSMMRMGAWEVDFSGNVNSFVTQIDCDAKQDRAVSAGLACGSDGNDSDHNNIQTGLLPSWFNFSAATVTDEGIRTGVHLSFQPGVDDGRGLDAAPGGNDGALGLNAANFRQVFLTFGNESMGTFKIGRDLGVFGSDAILNDMTLLGVGTVSDLAAKGGNTTLGRIGVGYLYADWKSQLQYTSPNFNGFTFTAALVDTWGAGGIAGISSGAATSITTDDLPHSATGAQDGDNFGFEAKINYAFDNGAGTSGLLWAGYIRQDVDFESGHATNALVTEDSPTADGYDVGFKVAVNNFDLVGYYYDGEGIGTTGFLWDGFDRTGEERDSDGWYAQARYRMPTGTLLGFSVGESNLDETAADRELASADRTLVESNESWVVGLYHPIGEALNLVVEYTETEAEAHNGNEAEEEVLAIGAIMFF